MTKKLKIPEYPFYYSSNISKNDTDLCGSIGLKILQYDEYDYIIESEQVKYYTDELKKYGAGKYEDFSFYHYNNQDFLIYDIFLQTQFPDLFKGIEHVTWLHPLVRESNFELHWEISIKEVFYNNVHSQKLRFELNPLFELIVGTNDFKINITDDFFNKYIGKGICSIKEYNSFNIFECNPETFTNKDIKKFPIIYISIIEAAHIFELKSEELFIQINNKWYFEIIFPIEDLETERWILGRIFMRKYPVKFSPSSRLIGFYIKQNEGDINNNDNKEEKDIDKKINNKNKSNIIIYVIIIVIALIFTGIGLFLGKQIFYPRKKKG